MQPQVPTVSLVTDIGNDLLYGDQLFFLAHLQGVLTCLRATTGEPVFGPRRLPGVQNVYASPVGAGGRVYIVDRNGNAIWCGGSNSGSMPTAGNSNLYCFTCEADGLVCGPDAGGLIICTNPPPMTTGTSTRTSTSTGTGTSTSTTA